jgi:hypothetical protein
MSAITEAPNKAKKKRFMSKILSGTRYRPHCKKIRICAALEFWIHPVKNCWTNPLRYELDYTDRQLKKI